MKTIIRTSLLALALAGCSTIQAAIGVVTGTTVTPGAAVIAANAFDAVEATGTVYLQLPTCPTATPICKSQSAVNAIVPAIRTGRTARNALEGAVMAANGSPVSATLLSALQAQTSTLQAIYANYKIGQ